MLKCFVVTKLVVYLHIVNLNNKDMDLQKLVSSVEFGVSFKIVECENTEEFISNAEIGQKWWNQDEELMYYKIQDEQENIIVFNLISGKAILV